MIVVQYCSFKVRDQGEAVYPGRMTGKTVERLDSPSMISLIQIAGKADSIESYDIEDIVLCAPVPTPSKIICVGLNYREHIKELGHDFPSEPVLFSKPSSSIIDPGDEIVLPRTSAQVDYEGEVAIIIGTLAKQVEDPESHIFGYTCINDVTARDIQRRSPDWTRAKGFDTFAPLGPSICTSRPKWVKTYLNGKVVQQSQTGDMIFGFEELVANIARVMTLMPGDVIATGTPFGVGKLNPGDIVVIEADGIGRLENPVRSEQ